MISSSQIQSTWLKCIAPSPTARLRLFCLHYAGGNAFVFRSWANQMIDGVEVYAVELPGHGTRLSEPAIDDMHRLVQALKSALLPYLSQPFAFFGHSMGALVSYELSQSLQQEHGLMPVHLFASGHRAPHIPDPEPPLHALPKAELIDALRRYNGTPETVLNNADLMELMIPVLRADFALLEQYRYSPHPPLACPISAYGGQKDWRTAHQNLAAWREHTQAAFSLQSFEGDHFFMHSAQASLLSALNTALKQLLSV